MHNSKYSVFAFNVSRFLSLFAQLQFTHDIWIRHEYTMQYAVSTVDVGGAESWSYLLFTNDVLLCKGDSGI